ncbi:dihydrolipoamide acetyltransferase family protein [Microbacterium sp. 179-I 3D4 NHS]|uniref:dihydrolipoamide acetyltransferase family protein n=1 Tax=Microbacterium sp. 179-I 3D4 NHS TaxID=3142381 RepID=UPI0039A3A43D
MSTLTARVFRLPDLGEGLTEAGLVQWLVQVGDTIATDQPIAEVETAKSIVELPSPFAGTVTALHGAAGDTIAVGAPVLEVAHADAMTPPPPTAGTDAAPDAGAEAPPEAGADAFGAPEHEAYRQEERAGSGNVLIGYGTTEGRRSRRRRRTSAAVQPPMPAERPAPAVPTAPASPVGTSTGDAGRRPVAVRSPLVRRLARDLGLDVRTIAATGADGAVTRADVLRAAVDHAVDGVPTPAATASVAPAAVAPASVVDGLPVVSRERLSPLRQAVSARLSRSRSEIPEATVWVDVDATRLWDLRREMAAEGGRAPSLTALVARFALIALEEHPVLASRLSDDATELLTFDGVNLGIATDTPRGLLVPVIPDAHGLSVERLDDALREITASARTGGLPPERLRGSTFTLNNYGGLGVDGSAAIINHPDVAILGVGRVLERPWAVEGQVVVRRVAQLSLVFDHRVCDGGYAASFLRRVVELIEHPLHAFGRV